MKLKHILKTSEFRTVFKNGDKIKGKHLILHIMPGTRNNDLKIGVTIPKRVIAQAVRRNYLKRRIYAYCRQKGKHFQKLDMLVISITQINKTTAKKSATHMLLQELEALLGKISIAKKQYEQNSDKCDKIL